MLGPLPALVLEGSSCSSSLPNRRPASHAAADGNKPLILLALWVRRTGTLHAAAPAAVVEVLPGVMVLLLVRRTEGDSGRTLPATIPVAAVAGAGTGPSPKPLWLLPPASPPAQLPLLLPCRASKDGGVAEAPLQPLLRRGP